MKFDGWSEHFRYDLWMKAFEAESIPKESYLRAYELDEILPWDILDVSIRKRFLQIELIKAKKEMRTEDCKWGHCYACGVPGNGEDTVLANAMPSVSAAAEGPREKDPAAYRDVAKGAAYRQKAMPELPSAARGPRAFTGTPRRYRIAFAKTGDARFLSHRNTMSRYLIRRIEETPNIDLKTNSEIVALEGKDELERVTWVDATTQQRTTVPIGHVFLMGA